MDESINNPKVNWLEKLKPSNRNKIIHKKYKNLQNDENNLSNIWGIDDDLNLGVKLTDNESVLSQKWDTYVKMSRKTSEVVLDFNNQSAVMNNYRDDMSMISENLEEINYIIGCICINIRREI